MTHATEIVVIRDVHGRFEVCFIKSMVNQDFDIQEQAVMDCLNVAGLRRLWVDATGMGKQFGERLVKAYPTRVHPVNFTWSNKEYMAKELKRRLQEGGLLIPRNQSLMQQLHTVRRSYLDSGRVRFDAPENGSDHADKFWALAMALGAATDVRAGVRARTIMG